MIPKIIHYTWFSEQEFPETIKKCIDSWKKHLPDYKFVLWNMESIKDLNVDFVKEALSVKKWAFASDYVRMYAIYKYGGIYLDTDVFLHKSLNSILENDFFIGREISWHICGHDTVNWLTSHCFGAIENHPYLAKCMEYYENTHYILTNNKNLPIELQYNPHILPYIQAIIAKQFGYLWNVSQNYMQYLNAPIHITIYPSNYFDGKSSEKECFCTHLALGSWREYSMYEPKYNLKYKILWRIELLLKKVLEKFKYTLIKLT